jgi:hypothetical protein
MATTITVKGEDLALMLMNAARPAVQFASPYHLYSSDDPARPAYPQELLDTVDPRNTWSEDAGPLHPKQMETVDEEVR